jgi:pimeloyl-ACP methyl ester carboxylesterase
VISQSNAAADANDGLRTTDYFISHESNDPFYGRHGIDPNVLLHVREVVMSGRERTVREDGKVLVLIHGGTFPGTVAYDTDISNVSLMRHFASLGWDTFALDLEGFGSSTRPMSMEVPEAFPDEPAPGRMEVTLANVSRVVDFVRDLRGVDRVHLLGWSMGATLEAPRYAIQYPDKVAKLVLYGANYQGWGRSEEETSKRVNAYNKEKVRFGYPASIERWGRLGTKAEFVDPIVFEAYRIAHLASDPKSGELGGAIRAPRGRNVDLELEEPHFDASKITVPTLVIRGEHDTFAKQEDNQALMDMLGGDQNEFVVIPDAGHFLHFERTNMQFYAALRDFLEK